MKIALIILICFVVIAAVLLGYLKTENDILTSQVQDAQKKIASQVQDEQKAITQVSDKFSLAQQSWLATLENQLGENLKLVETIKVQQAAMESQQIAISNLKSERDIWFKNAKLWQERFAQYAK